jgi:CRISPR-associated endonuclease/helicase Cas3
VRFLKAFDVPVLAMTASLPEDRLRALRDNCGLQVFPDDPARFVDLAAQSGAERYRVRRIAPDSALNRARAALEAGQSVLWVANTVARCQANARQLRKLVEADRVLCYHSRFRLMDRRDRHARAIAAFQGAGGALALVTTQVCEMSLDLDADVLISEIAPVPALIQRMGRCCRVPHPGERRGDVFLYTPADHRPYERRELPLGEHFTDHFAGREATSQDDLAGYLAELEAPDPFTGDGFTGFLDSGWYAFAREDSFREDADDHTVDGVLDHDLEAYLRAERARNGHAEGFILPIPRRRASPHQALGRTIYLAPASHYSSDLGLLHQEVERCPTASS